MKEKSLAYLLIIVAALGVIGPLVLKQYNLSLLGSYLGVPMILAPVAWLRVKHTKPLSISLAENYRLTFSLVFLVCYSISLLILHSFELRIVPYYGLVAVMAVLILAQILFFTEFSNRHIIVILSQVIMLFLNIIWGVTLKYDYFIGRTDLFFHSWLVENLLTTGHISQQVFDVYEAFPLFHLLSAMVYEVCNFSISPYKVMYIINGLIFAGLLIIIFLIVVKIATIKIALLATLFTCVNPDVIFYGMYSIPRSAIFFLEGLLVYLFLQHKDYANLILLSIVTIGIIVFHTASTPFIIAILILYYILQRIGKLAPSHYLVDVNFLLFLSVATISYWMFYGVAVFRSLVGSLFSQALTGVLTKSIVETPLMELFNYLQYSPLLFYLLLGVLGALSAKGLQDVSTLFCLMGLLLVPVTFPGPALLLNKLAGNMNLNRFGEYSFLFICITAAIGLDVLFYRLKKFASLGVLALFLTMTFLAVSNDFTASDNPLVKRPFYTFYLDQEEIVAFNSLAQLADGYLMSDYISCRYLDNSIHAEKMHVLETDSLKQKFLRQSSSDILLVRNGELSKRPLKLYAALNDQFYLDPNLSDTMEYFPSNLPLWDTLEGYNTIYDSGSVQGFN